LKETVRFVGVWRFLFSMAIIMKTWYFEKFFCNKLFRQF